MILHDSIFTKLQESKEIQLKIDMNLQTSKDLHLKETNLTASKTVLQISSAKSKEHESSETKSKNTTYLNEAKNKTEGEFPPRQTEIQRKHRVPTPSNQSIFHKYSTLTPPKNKK